MCHALDAVTASQAFDCDFPVTSVDLEREQVLPLCAAYMQERCLAGWRAQRQERVVVHWHPPEVGCGDAVDVTEFTQKPSREVDQVNALIDEFASTGHGRIRPPLTFVANAPSVAIAAANEHQ